MDGLQFQFHHNFIIMTQINSIDDLEHNILDGSFTNRCFKSR